MRSSEVTPVALVTGAGRRLGRHIAYALAEKGFDLIVHYNGSRKGAQEAVKHIIGMGRRAVAIRADLTKTGQLERMIRLATKRFHRIDVLVNNAAIFIDSPLEKTSEAIWDRTLALNLKATFLCSQLVSKNMLKHKRGRIINIASLGGLQAWHKHLPYSVSKAGVIMLTRCLAKALAPSVLVNAVAPGTIRMAGEDDPRQEYISTRKILLRRYGNPADITSLVVYLATTAEYISGQTVVVDGGRSA